jgi:hypothetical protein
MATVDEDETCQVPGCGARAVGAGHRTNNDDSHDYQCLGKDLHMYSWPPFRASWGGRTHDEDGQRFEPVATTAPIKW